MSRRVKELVIEEIRRRLGDTREMLLIDDSRLDAVTANRFRLGLRQGQIHALGVKNSLARRALHEAGITALDELLQGPTTIVWGGEDIVALSKEITRWAKEIDDLQIKGGTTEGNTLTAADVEALSKSPSREELIGQIVASVMGVGGTLVGAILGPGATLAGQIESRAEAGEEGS